MPLLSKTTALYQGRIIVDSFKHFSPFEDHDKIFSRKLDIRSLRTNDIFSFQNSNDIWPHYACDFILCLCYLLVTKHIVCEILSPMQELVRLPEFQAHFGQNTLLPRQDSPPPPKIEIWSRLRTLSFRLVQNTHPLPENDLCRDSLCVETDRCIPHGYHPEKE